MNLRPNELVYGVAPEILIACARQLHRFEKTFSTDDFCEAIGAPKLESQPVIDHMVADGFMRSHAEIADSFEPTTKLAQLALARISNGLPRSEAEQLLKSVVRKAEEINGLSESHGYTVTCLVVFGSYLSEKLVLGDLDIGVASSWKPVQSSPVGDWKSVLSASPISSLRLRKPNKISIHELTEVLELKTPFQVVYGELPLNTAR